MHALPLLAAGVSLLAHPLYLEDEPPELRSACNVLVLFGEPLPGLAREVRDAEQALELARAAEQALRAGEPFEEVAARCSEDVNARDGAVLGTFGPGMLPPELDDFLFSAALGEISGPLPVAGGWQVLQRVETHAAVRQILLGGHDARERLARVRAGLERGADFATLAQAFSDDRESAEKGGALAIFERGRRDRLVKRAAFEAEIGAVVGPIESPLGLHLLERVPLDELDPSLRESHWARGRAILVRHELSEGPLQHVERSPGAARALVDELERRIRAGEDIAELAREHDDDLGGRERAGDLGWIHRFAPGLSPALDRLFLCAPGELVEVQATPQGFLLLRRER